MASLAVGCGGSETDAVPADPAVEVPAVAAPSAPDLPVEPPVAPVPVEPTPPAEVAVPVQAEEPAFGIEILETRLMTPTTWQHEVFDAAAPEPRTSIRGSGCAADRACLSMVVEATNLSGAVIDACAEPLHVRASTRVAGARGERATSAVWDGSSIMLHPAGEPGGPWAFHSCGSPARSRLWRPGDRRRFGMTLDMGNEIRSEIEGTSIDASVSIAFACSSPGGAGCASASAAEAAAGRGVVRTTGGHLLYVDRMGSASASVSLPSDLLTARVIDLDGGRGQAVLFGDRIVFGGPWGPEYGFAAWSGPFAAPASHAAPADPALPSVREGAWSMRVTAIDQQRWTEARGLDREHKLLRVSATISLDPTEIESIAETQISPWAAYPEGVATAQANVRRSALRTFDCSALSVLTEQGRVRIRNGAEVRAICATLLAVNQVSLTWEIELDRYALPFALVYDLRRADGLAHAFHVIASERLLQNDPR